MKASCEKRSSNSEVKRESIEPYAAHNVLLRPKICDTTDLLFSVIHQYKVFKYKKMNMYFLLGIMTFFLFHF